MQTLSDKHIENASLIGRLEEELKNKKNQIGEIHKKIDMGTHAIIGAISGSLLFGWLYGLTARKGFKNRGKKRN